jgi:hypothetical protein
MVALGWVQASILRILQYGDQMDGDLEGVISGDMHYFDVAIEGWMSASMWTEEDIKNLDDQYFGFGRWLQAGLRSLGLDDDAISKHMQEWWDDVRRAQATHIEKGGKPYLYRSVNRQGDK